MMSQQHSDERFDVETVFAEMLDDAASIGQLILDEQDRITEVTPTARQYLDIPEHLDDDQVTQAIPPELVSAIQDIVASDRSRLSSTIGRWHLTLNLERYEGHTIVEMRPTARVHREADSSSSKKPLIELHQIALAASSAMTADELLDDVLCRIRRLMPVDAFVTSLILPGDDFATTIYRAEGDQRFPPRRPAAPDIQYGLQLHAPVVMDFISDKSIRRTERFGDPTKPVRSVLAVPLRSDGQTVGQLTVQSYSLGAYTPADADLITAVAQCVANALYRATVLQDLERQAARESLLRQAAEQLHVASDLTTFVDRVTEAVFRQVGAVITSISTVDQDTGVIFRRAVRAVEGTPHAPQPNTIMPQGGAASRAVESGEQVYIADISQDEHDETQSWMRSNIGAIVATPIQDGSRCYGVIVTSRGEPHSFDRHDLEMLKSVAELVTEGLRAATLLDESEQYIRDLVRVQNISALASSSLEMSECVEQIADAVTEIFDVDGCVVRLIEDGQLVRIAATGATVEVSPISYPAQGTLSGHVVMTGETIAIRDRLAEIPDYRSPFGAAAQTQAYLGVPLRDHAGNPFGVIALHRQSPYHWSDRDIRLLDTIATNVGVAIRNARDFEQTRDTLRASIESLAAAVDAKDSATLYHSRNVAAYAVAIARRFGFDQEHVDQIELAGLLHDVGKIGVPDDILVKPGPLDPAEWAAMQLHPVIGSQILSGNPLLEPLLPMIRHHHERWDGFGYPDRLAGEDIPTGAAIIALADAFDTMTSARTYRDPLDLDEAVREIRQGRATQFHPDVVDAFFESLEDGSIELMSSSNRHAASVSGAATASLDRTTDARALMIFHGMAQEIATVNDLNDLVRNIAELIRGAMGDFEVHVNVVEPGTRRLRAQAVAGHGVPLDASDGRFEFNSEGIVAWVMEHETPANVPDVLADPRYRIFDDQLSVRSELVVPLIAEDQLVGVINLESERPSAFSRQDEQLLVTTADYLAQALHTALLLDTVRKQATTDALTGLANHHSFYTELQQLVSRAEAEQRPLSLMILDVNNLKDINDTYGHLAGDQALRGIANALRQHARKTDVVCRYGGDEFAVIMPNTDHRAAHTAARKFERQLESQTATFDAHTLPLPTFSWGIAEFPGDASRPAELVTIADASMYADKNLRSTPRSTA